MENSRMKAVRDGGEVGGLTTLGDLAVAERLISA